MTVVAVSGGFDPVHCGHIRMIQEAAQHGRVMVILNSDDWLMRKKGFVFMKSSERFEVMKSLRWVDQVVFVNDDDDTVCEAITRHLKPGDIFANGGDRTADNTPELKLCHDMRVGVLWGVGGEKIQSSSELARNVHA